MSSQQEEASQDAPSKDEQSEQKSSQDASSSSSSKPPSIIYGPSAPEPLTMTFGQLLDYHAEVRGQKPAVISHVQGKTIWFKDLRLRSLQLARAFSKDGIGKGDLVAISLGSRIEYFEVTSSFEPSNDIQAYTITDFLCLRIPWRGPRASKLCIHRDGDDQAPQNNQSDILIIDS